MLQLTNGYFFVSKFLQKFNKPVKLTKIAATKNNIDYYNMKVHFSASK